MSSSYWYLVLENTNIYMLPEAMVHGHGWSHLGLHIEWKEENQEKSLEHNGISGLRRKSKGDKKRRKLVFPKASEKR